MKRVLITGCSGFLGRHLVKLLGGDSQYRLFGLTDVEDDVIPGVEIRHLDIRDRDSLFSAIDAWKPQQVFHLAAITNVGFSWTHQQLTYEVNFMGTLHLLEALVRSVPHSRVLVMSSAEIAGLDVQQTPEGPQLFIRSPYALSKAAMEMLASLFIAEGNLTVVPVRAFNFTGPGQGEQFVASDFARQVARIEAELAPPVIQVGNLSARRDFSDVRDMARYVAAAGFYGENGRLMRLGSGRVIEIGQILDTLLSLTRVPIRVEVKPERFRPLDIPELKGDCPILHKEMGLSPRYSLEQTLSDLLDEWRGKVRGDKKV
ncbi:MAG: GDP-mannose 4,6-dehydratase [Acidobacteriota bacterium]|jgi:GDP-4-dehydro-6-deoxy-D-mannose reductase|nr:GDP-mannose 4,6-dehydratase [Acidobacteriota bacterium]